MAYFNAKVYDIRPVKIRFNGDFSYSKLYNTIHKWLRKNMNTVVDTKYKEKPGAFKGMSGEIKTYADQKITEYFKHIINTVIKTEDYNERIIEVNGKKQKIGHGKVLIMLNGTVQVDYKDLFNVEGKPFTVQFYKTLAKFLFFIRKYDFTMKEMDALQEQLEDLSNEIKYALNMKSKV
jgi:hypothetical protein